MLYVFFLLYPSSRNAPDALSIHGACGGLRCQVCCSTVSTGVVFCDCLITVIPRLSRNSVCPLPSSHPSDHMPRTCSCARAPPCPIDRPPVPTAADCGLRSAAQLTPVGLPPRRRRCRACVAYFSFTGRYAFLLLTCQVYDFKRRMDLLEVYADRLPRG